MAIALRHVTGAPLEDFDAAAPDGAIIGIVGSGPDIGKLLRLAAGMERPESGSVEISGAARLVGSGQPLDLAPVAVLCLDQALALLDLPARERAARELD
ncbi:MAG TPA: hypothetical protein VGS58_18625, partial [Candidatus Sulfopaludibacter sp.]|nr:hypothetical protein [Candidatus Sulfopaludibacter sp.]